MRKIGLIAFLLVNLCMVSYGQSSALRIIEQPKPELPQRHGSLDVQGTVTLRVEFLETGDIGEVSVTQQLNNDLDQKAMAAARKIKFEPETKDGKAIPVIKSLDYFYSWNGGWRDLRREEAQTTRPSDTAKAEAVIAKAVEAIGGERYLKVTSQVGRGQFSIIKDNVVASFQTFVDVIVFPDKERTEFKGGGSRTTQVNTGETGWVFDGDQEIIKIQNENQVSNFKQSLRTNIDTLLRGKWKGDAVLSYLGRRPATLGKRNDAIKLTYRDGFAVEFEFSVDNGLPQKAMYKRISIDGEEVKEEDRYAQFVDFGGIKTPLIIDRFTNGKQSSRINFELVEYNRTFPDSIFTKPANAKEAKKDLKL